MEKFQFWLTLWTAVIPATITGFLSFGVSWLKNRSEIKSLEKEHENALKEMAQNHQQELENIRHSHELRITELEKVSKLNAETDLALKQNDLTLKVVTGEVDFDTILSLAEKANKYNRQQALNQKFVQKTSKK